MNTITQPAALGRALFTSNVAATAFALLLALSGSVRAASIGVSFFHNEGTLNATDSAGASPYAQTNFNKVTTSTASSLKDNTGTTTIASVSVSGGTYGQTTVEDGLAGPDEVLNANFYFGTPISFTISSIPYANYSLVVYDLDFDNNDEQKITLGATSYYSLSPTAGSPGYLDSNAATPFTYTQATSTSQGSPTPNSDYVVFTGLTASSLTLTDTYISGSNGVGQISGFQVVATPEPGPAVLAAIGGIGLFAIRHRRQAAS